MTIKTLIHKISNRWKKLRLQPIRVFCFHHVCENFDESSMHSGDWVNIEAFQQMVEDIRENDAEFISLSEAYRHICSDWIRRKKYAVVTFDDGYESLHEILPWLESKRIPVTLFINGKYLDGVSYREKSSERYLTKEDVFSMKSPLLEIAHHGWEHVDMSVMSESQFVDSIDMNEAVLQKHPRFVPFLAFTYGKCSEMNLKVLKQKNIIPVLTNGGKNYNDNQFIDREIKYVPGKW